MPSPRDETREARRLAQAITGQCVGARLRALSRLVTRIYDDALRPVGVKFSQMNVLMVIAARGPIGPHQVATRLGLEKSTLSRNLRLLEENGWIDSQPAETGNALQLQVTRAGRRLVREAGPPWRAAQARVTAALGETATKAIGRAFERVQQLD